MISPAEAESLVLAQVGRLPAEKCRLAEAAGRVLRQEIVADRDGPPFDRATLDGICLRFSDWEAGRRDFPLAGMQRAGAEPIPAPPENAAIEIMTGAPVPAPCDCVLPVEDFERTDAGVRAQTGATLHRGGGIHARGSDFRSGEALLHPGVRLGGRELAIVASCGVTELQVTVQPRIAILTTGDELVDVEDVPKPHQVRRSNDLALRATLQAAGFSRIELNHLPDNRQAISWNLERLLQSADAIIVSGGVSKGAFDFLPGVLDELGVRAHFHGVAQRPGKPMWFGTFERPGDFLNPDDTRVVAIFALPGNPVSAFVCCHRYALPALGTMSGVIAPKGKRAALEAPWRPHERLTLFVPAVVRSDEQGRLLAQLRPTNTSGDFASIATTDGFVEIAPGRDELPAGTAVPFQEWR